MRTEFQGDEERESSRDSSDPQVGGSTTSIAGEGFGPDEAFTPMARGSAPDVAVDLARDRRLAAALQAGDHRLVMEILVDAHGECVYRYCRSVLGTPAESDDVSQTVFVQAFQCLKNLPRVRNVEAWLLGIARNRCIDRLRAIKRTPLTLDNSDLRALIDRDAGDDICDDDPRVSKALDACLDRLRLRDRAVLFLRFHDCLSYSEMSESLSETAGALRVRLVRALAALRKCLEGKGIRP